MFENQQQHARDDIEALGAQIEHLKQAIVLLQSQLADMRDEKNKWQSRAERVSLVAAY